MFENLLTALLQLVSEHGVLAVILGAVIEEIIVPIPSPAIPMAAGALIINAESWILAALEIFLLVSIPASFGSVISSYFVYGIAYRGGRPAIERYGRFIDISLDEIDKVEEKFVGDRDGYYVALLRAIPVVPLSMVSGAAGLFEMNWKRYGFWSLVGMLPRTFFLGMLGWWAKDRFLVIASRIDSISTLTVLVVAGIIAGFLIYRMGKKIYPVILQRI